MNNYKQYWPLKKIKSRTLNDRTPYITAMATIVACLLNTISSLYFLNIQNINNNIALENSIKSQLDITKMQIETQLRIANQQLEIQREILKHNEILNTRSNNNTLQAINLESYNRKEEDNLKTSKSIKEEHLKLAKIIFTEVSTSALGLERILLMANEIAPLTEGTSKENALDRKKGLGLFKSAIELMQSQIELDKYAKVFNIKQLSLIKTYNILIATTKSLYEQSDNYSLKELTTDTQQEQLPSSIASNIHYGLLLSNIRLSQITAAYILSEFKNDIFNENKLQNIDVENFIVKYTNTVTETEVNDFVNRQQKSAIHYMQKFLETK